MKRILTLLLVIIIIAGLFGCSPSTQQYQTEFLGTFDTVVSIIGYAESQKEFTDTAEVIYDNFSYMNKLFDIYNDYDGINNVKTINDNAGVAPVVVDQLIIELVQTAKTWYKDTNGAVNIALGPVLEIWHNYRTDGIENPDAAELPDIHALQEAAKHTDINKVLVDEENSTVYIEDGMRLDVGSIAKGFATEHVANLLERSGVSNVLISAGGNVRAIEKPADERSKWGVGIKDPDSTLSYSTNEENLLDVAFITDLSVVTSGSYERYFVVDEFPYHHIIDGSTLFPAAHYKSVTVITKNATVADVLSTALFIMPIDTAMAYVQSKDGVEALWVTLDDQIVMSPGMKPYLRDFGDATNK